MTETLQTLVRELLEHFDVRVPESGEFPDLHVGRMVQFGDPTVSPPGRVELFVMHMDARLDPAFDQMRFLSIRVMKSIEGGYASLTCFHDKKAALRASLEREAEDPSFLLERVAELAEGLPEETNPDLWR